MISRLWCERLAGQTHAGVQVLYVSPLKALNLDIERNLWAPLAGVSRVAAAQGQQWPELRIGVRSGDTPAAARTGMLGDPPEILITTPESLYLLLTGEAGQRKDTDLQVVLPVEDLSELPGGSIWGAARWSLIRPLGVDPPPLAERAERWVDVLLRRYGIVSWGLVPAEDPPIPWGAL